jgi:hypothetical protein
MRWLDSLPLSHRFRLLINLLPALVIVAGAAIGLQFAMDEYPLYVGDQGLADGRPGTPNVALSLEYWQHAPGGVATLVESPWGEKASPATAYVFGYRLYNPYSTGPDNSRRFFDWQFARATEAVYGRALEPGQIGAAKKAGLTPRTARGRMRILNASAMLLILLLLLFVRDLFRWRLVHRLSRRARILLAVALAAPPLGAILALEFNPIPGGRGVVTVQHLVEWLLLRVGVLLPANPLVVGVAALVPVLLMYLLLERLFAKSELLGPMRVVSMWHAES